MMVRVTVYSTGPDCMQCAVTYRCLDGAGIQFDIINVTEDADALQFIKQLGYSSAPVVIVDDEPDLRWSGFRHDLITELAARLGADHNENATNDG